MVGKSSLGLANAGFAVPRRDDLDTSPFNVVGLLNRAWSGFGPHALGVSLVDADIL